MKPALLACLGLIGLLTLAATSALAQTDTQTDSSSTNSTEQKTVTEKVTTIRETDTQIVQQQQDDNRVRTVAIFIKNRSSDVPDEKVSVLEDFITGRLTDKGFRVISREDVLNAVSSFANAGANKGDANLPGADLDALLSNNTSALRLAQNLGADYVLDASITTYGTDTINYNGDGIQTQITESKMELSYKLLDIAAGGSLTAGVVEVSKKDRATPEVSVSRDTINELLDEGSTKLCDVLGAKAEEGRIRSGPSLNSSLVSFTVDCSRFDLVVPEAVRNEAGDYVLAPSSYAAEPSVTVALDGIALGTTPGPFQSLPGLHKILISGAGFKPYQATINIRDGLALKPELQMDDEAYARWHDTSSFLEDLKSHEKLTDAQVEVLQGMAQKLRQSGYRVDIRKNINVNDQRNINVNKDIHEDTVSRNINDNTANPPPAATTQPSH
jgi:hypothetical protein